MENQNKALTHELLKMCWYMRGSISIDQAYALGPQERKIIADIVKDNMETVKKPKMPQL